MSKLQIFQLPKAFYLATGITFSVAAVTTVGWFSIQNHGKKKVYDKVLIPLRKVLPKEYGISAKEIKSNPFENSATISRLYIYSKTDKSLNIAIRDFKLKNMDDKNPVPRYGEISIAKIIPSSPLREKLYKDGEIPIELQKQLDKMYPGFLVSFKIDEAQNRFLISKLNIYSAAFYSSNSMVMDHFDSALLTDEQGVESFSNLPNALSDATLLYLKTDTVLNVSNFSLYKFLNQIGKNDGEWDETEQILKKYAPLFSSGTKIAGTYNGQKKILEIIEISEWFKPGFKITLAGNLSGISLQGSSFDSDPNQLSLSKFYLGLTDMGGMSLFYKLGTAYTDTSEKEIKGTIKEFVESIKSYVDSKEGTEIISVFSDFLLKNNQTISLKFKPKKSLSMQDFDGDVWELLGKIIDIFMLDRK